MNVVLVLVGSLTAAAITVIVFLLTPADRRRGIAGLIGVGMLVVGGTATAPPVVQDVAQIGSVIVLLFGIALGNGVQLRGLRPFLVLLVSFVVVVAAVTAIAYPAGAIAFVKLASVAVAAVLCFSGFTPADRSAFVAGFVVLAVGEAALGIVESLFTHEPLPWGFKVRADGSSSVLLNPLLPGAPIRVSGSLGHPIPYAAVLGTAMVFAMAVRRAGWAVARWAVLLLCGSGILLSGSRTVIVGVLAAAVVLLWVNAPGGRAVRVFSVLGGLVVGGIVFAADVRAAVERLLGSGSYTNRAGAIDAVPALLARDPLESFFGSGFGSDFDLYHRGFFPQNGFMVIDNQVVTTLGTEGIVGVVLLLALFVVAWVCGGALNRSLLALFFVMLFSFDYFGWFAMFALLMVACVLPSGRAQPVPAQRLGKSVGDAQARDARA